MNPYGLLVGVIGIVLIIIAVRNTQDSVWSMLTGRGATGTPASTTPTVAPAGNGTVAWNPIPSGLGTDLFHGVSTGMRIR